MSSSNNNNAMPRGVDIPPSVANSATPSELIADTLRRRQTLVAETNRVATEAKRRLEEEASRVREQELPESVTPAQYIMERGHLMASTNEQAGRDVVEMTRDTMERLERIRNAGTQQWQQEQEALRLNMEFEHLVASTFEQACRDVVEMRRDTVERLTRIRNAGIQQLPESVTPAQYNMEFGCLMLFTGERAGRDVAEMSRDATERLEHIRNEAIQQWEQERARQEPMSNSNDTNEEPRPPVDAPVSGYQAESTRRLVEEVSRVGEPSSAVSATAEEQPQVSLQGIRETTFKFGQQQ